MLNSKEWKYCVVGNITKSHTDKDGILRYGTPAFSGGTKVYLCGKYWDPSRETIAVIGMTRGKKYHVIDTVPMYIENVRCSKAYHPAVITLMNNWEMHHLWWSNTAEDKKETIEFTNKWHAKFSNRLIPVLTQFYGKTITKMQAYGIDEFDFTPNILGVDFSVGQYGYVVLEFEDSNLYISIDGLSTVVPARKNIKEIPFKDAVRNCFVGAVLESIEYDGESYQIQFRDFDVLCGRYVPNEGYADRSYFELAFPFI